jgi:hypothetical protein
MKKCIVCDNNTLQHMPKWCKTSDIVPKMIEAPPLWHEIDEYHTELGEPIICQLCMYGIMSQLNEYEWDGEKLWVKCENGGEYQPNTQKPYKPTRCSVIQFEYDERRMKWMAMPRSR